MKKYIIGLAVITAMAFTACDSSSQLAKEITGTWSGTPQRLVDNSASTATIIDSYTFDRDSTGYNGGDVSITGVVSVTGQINGSDAIIQPFSLSASALATIKGTWQAVDGDEIRFNWDSNSLTVKVDPDAVVLSTDLLTGTEAPAVDSMRPQLAESIRAQIAQAVEVKYLGIRKIDDIKIRKNGEMKFELHDQDYFFTRSSN